MAKRGDSPRGQLGVATLANRVPCRAVRPFAPVVICILSFVLGFTACAKRETPVEEGIRTHTLLLGNKAEPGDLDPQISTAVTEGTIQMALFEGLTALDEKTGRAVPAAAERWEASPDGLRWTFHLRTGLAWSNGDPLTADDFVQSWRRALAPALASPNAYLFSAVKNADAFNAGKLTDPAALGFSAPDERTVVIVVTQPTTILPLLTATTCWFPLNPRALARFDALGKRGPAWTRPGNLVSNGPFTLTEWTPDARLVVSKNPRYWDESRTQLERIVFFPIGSDDVEERNFRAGQVHLTYGLPLAKLAGYRDRAPDQLRVDPLLGVRYLSFNCGKPPLDNPKLRRALALAIDREAISRAVYFGAWAPAHSFTPNPCGDYVPRARIDLDFDAARRLLAEAGYPGGRGLPVLPVQVSNDTNTPRAAEALQAMWKKELGVAVTIEPFEQKTFLQNLQSKNHLIGLSGTGADFVDPIEFLCLLASDSGSNDTGWSNPAYDRLLNQAARTVDAAARLEIFHQAEAMIFAETPLTPLVFHSKTYLAHPAVKGWEPAPLGLRRYQFVRLEK